jgi:hypothetical protein
MSVYERTDHMLERAARGEADIGEIEECISATRADLDRNLSAVEQRLSPDELIDQAVDYLRSGPTEFLSNFGQAVKTNPVPAALMTVSVAWLMFGGRRSSNNGSAAYRGGSWAADENYDELDSLGGDTARSDRGDGSSTVHRVTETVRERAARLGDRASQLAGQASSAGSRVSQKFNEVGDKMTEASKHAQEVFQTARERIAQARETLGQQPKRLQAGYHDLADNHPFVLGALAFVAGAAVAASLRRTQIEDRIMGEYRDAALEEAERRARSELHRGAAAAKAALTPSGEGESPDEQLEMEKDSSGRDRDMDRDAASSSRDSFH